MTKVVNIQKDHFDRDQEILAAILNDGYDKISKFNLDEETAMAIGPSGQGKSTTLNLFYGTEFAVGLSTGDCTREIIMQRSPKGPWVIDSMGFLPTLRNIGRIFIALFLQGVLPDYFIYPAATDRIVDIISLQQLIPVGLFKVVLFPFSAKSYYVAKKFLKSETEEVAERKAISAAIEETTVSDIQSFIKMTGYDAHISVFTGNDRSSPIPHIEGSMRKALLNRFFSNGKYKPVSWEDHIGAVRTDANELLRGLLIDGIRDLKIQNGKVVPPSKQELLEYLKG